MAATRDPFTSATVGDVGGPALVNQIAENTAAFWAASCLPVTSIGGTANAITGTVTPDFNDAGLLDGMRFTFSPTAANDGAVTIALNDQDPVPLLLFDGSALTGGEIASGAVYMIVYWGGSFALMGNYTPPESEDVFDYQVFTTSGTWTKPEGTPNHRMVFIQCWGAGGGGNNSGGLGGGGGGGAYASIILPAASLGSSVSVTVGAGGTSNGGSGAKSNFGGHLEAFGGRGGGTPTDVGGGIDQARGGGGAGEIDSGNAGSGGAIGGGNGFRTTNSSDTSTPDGQNAQTIWGGGGGGGYNEAAADVSGNGGSAVWGGGGGAGGDNDESTNGSSVYGGRGGDQGQDGAPRGGGGGRNADGGRGEVRVSLL